MESISKEYEKLLLMIDDFKDILKNHYRIDIILKNELLGLSSRYSDDRRTAILDKEDIKDLVKEDRIGYFFRDGHFQWTEAKGSIDQITVPEDTEGLNFLFVTRHGQVMRSPIDDFLRAHTDETITLKNGNELIRTFLVGDSGEIMLLFYAGQSIRFKVGEVSIMGRKSCGVRGMNTNDVVTALYIGESDVGKRLVTFTEKGYAKQTLLAEYPIQDRGGKGLAAAKISDKTDLLVNAVLSDGTGKYKKIPLEDRTKTGQA
ncbi:DNA gyrase C-terminal beta-propeller domain-containing protein [Desulfosporosinus metallidurans]|uniref:DNA gyrase subunit A n=1 Tax=Desulfosporosinus metallidurans TaxID=1888891 RepID=A0A1Q8QFA6_9FIRM|nr:DNA gyrase subunit A [Desulfosporosinus metallidurans]